MNLEAEISPAPWIFGTQVSLLDISILPFIRQFKIANPSWFFAQDFKKLINLLNTFEASNLFKLAMEKYEIWDPESSDKIIFPSQAYKPIES
jgi:glutathione S-transferase